MKNYYEAYYRELEYPIKIYGCATVEEAVVYAHRIRPNQILIKMELVEDD